ncbi:MAG TPA: hypothetical protein VK465_16180 [Fibrobacteria bacterium]|nr:hypothetical protein [Fibrobacteria bacterium]
MSPILALLLGSFILPLFISSWRVALACLFGQGVLMTWIAWHGNHHPGSPETIFALLDYLAIRGMGLPWALFSVLRSRKVPYAINIIPPNLLAWIMTLGLVLLAFNFSALLMHNPEEQRHAVSVVVSGVLLGLFILSAAKTLFSQMLGAIFIENSIALFELTHDGHTGPWILRLGLMGVAVLTFTLYRWYLANGGEKDAEKIPESLEGPTI